MPLLLPLRRLIRSTSEIDENSSFHRAKVSEYENTGWRGIEDEARWQRKQRHSQVHHASEHDSR